MDKRETLCTLNNALKLLAALRIFLIFLPQNGYIHPDEYFQSVDVLAAKIFGVEHSPAWEFNTTFPIRGMTIPYFTTGMCFFFLRDINDLAMEYLSLNVVSPYFLLVMPRFIMGLFSFTVDYCLYKICYNNNEKYKTRLIVLGSSYVLLVYSTRTFSNSIELILFSLLLLFVCESQTFSNELVRKQEYIDYRYKNSESLVEKVKFHKLRLYLVPDTYRNGLIIASIVIFGIFNRPTFIGFAVIPIFFWIYRGTGTKRVSVTQFHTRILFFAFCSLPAFILNVIIDSFYYGYLTWGEIGMLDVSIDNFVVTPLNFLKYNVLSTNLEKHGLHPRYLHFLINVPLLFNILGALALFKIGEYYYLIIQGKLNLLPSVKSIKMVMIMSFISPILMLSVFPHQEPRFIIPVILPLVYLHGMNILPEPDNILITVPEYTIEGRKKKQKLEKQNYLFFKAWLIFNSLLLVFYGFIHQGGVYFATNYLYKDIRLTALNTQFNIITSNIYSLPESFFLEKAADKLYSHYNTKYSIKKRVHLYERGSEELIALISLIGTIAKFTYAQECSKSHTFKYKIYLLISSSRSRELEDILQKSNVIGKKIDKFGPHISVEAFPDFSRYCLRVTSIFYDNCQILSFWDYLNVIGNLCQLTLYEIQFSNQSTIVNNTLIT
ncbi:phosphatidylinositol glycan anchor biosynthesis class Z isoform X1 [Rhynchophorus ferrugineus]|uniref:phosphatidylinositol glycan anchor biosynthesis class Z isoform X1 n=1 Tax=Rhynchophorus ferrugineus TaxID=354439 RepID=UPI003FCC2CE4